MAHETREGWLRAAADEMRKRVFTTGDHEFEVPEFQVSVGWPKGKRSDTNVIGECFNTAWTETGVPSVFISPKLKAEMEVLGCLAHEMIHVRDNCQSGHRGHFAYVFKHIGMIGKRTQCAVGDEMKVRLLEVIDAIGPYPHAKMRTGVVAIGPGQKKQTTRMLKVICQDADCGYTIRAARSWIEVGLPTCACGSEMMEV